MSYVTFVPKQGTTYHDTGWPDKVIGDGFIVLSLDYADGEDDSATYRDQFGDEYTFLFVSHGEWTLHVREDGY